MHALAILSDVRRSAVYRRDLNDTESHKKDHISLGDQQSHYLQIFERLYSQQKEDQQGGSFQSHNFPQHF